MDAVPLTDLLPVQAPEAVQDVALVALQVNVALPPLATLAGLAVKFNVGGAASTVTVTESDADPPVPLQLSV